MGWREDLANFDLGRLTLVGWLSFLLAAAAGIGAAILVGTLWDSWFPPRPGGGTRPVGPAGIAGFGGAVAAFFIIKVLLNLAGISLMRPKQEGESADHDKA